MTEVPVTGFPVTEVPVTTAAPQAARRGRTTAIVGIIAVVLVALGVGGFFLFRSNDPEFSLAAATSSGRDPLGLSFTSRTSVMGTEVVATAEADPSGKFLHMKMDLGQSMAVLGVSEPIEVIVNVSDRVLYMGSAFFEALGAPVETPWIKIDRDAAEAAGEDTSFFDQLQVDDPTNTTDLFATAKDVEDLGEEEIDGEKVRHYRVGIAAADVVAANPSLEGMLGDTQLADTIDYDVWVTKDNRIRRISYDTEIDVSVMSTTIDFDRLTEPVVVTEPPADEVTDALDLG
ncbi:MAG: lipoprotein [Actinomycetota bacterium]